MHTIAAAARRSLGPFCANECKAYCCRKGTLRMSKRQADAVTHGRTQEFVASGRLVPILDEYSLRLDGGCPSLAGYRCTIHSSRNRPKACAEFPLWIRDGVAFASPRCTAVRSGLLYPWLRRLAAMGLRVVERSPYGDVDMNGFQGVK